MDCILAIDIGTTSAKALVVNDEGRVLKTAQKAYPTYYPQAGFAEQDPLQILQSVKEIIRECAVAHCAEVRGVSFSSAMHSLVAVDTLNNPLTPLLIWADTRSRNQTRKLRKSIVANAIYQSTGTPLHPMAPLSKLLWLKEERYSVFVSAHKFISIKEFVVYHLCGEWCVDYSVASATGLFDVHHLSWCELSLDYVGLGQERLSQVVSPYHTLPIKKEVVRALSLPKGTRLVMGANDGCLANLGSNAMKPGMLSLTIGTSGAVRMASTTFAHDPQQRVFNYRLDEHFFITGGATNNGLVLFDWFQKLMQHASPLSFSHFVEEALSVSPGSDGLLFLPYVFGERSPLYNPDQRGVFLGLAQHHQKAHLMRALIEGISFQLRTIMASVEYALTPATKVLASGGFTRSRGWLQMMATLLNKEVCLRDVNDASSLGAARIGFKALGIPAVFHSAEKEESFYPQQEYRNTYDDLFGVFQRTATVVNPEFETLVKYQK